MKKIGAGIMAIDKNDGRILMGRRGFDQAEANTFAPFGGTFEAKDKIPKNAAIREFKEETKCNVRYQITKKPFYINDNTHIKFYTYIGLFDGKFDVKINSENLDYEWFSIDLLPENLHPGVKQMFDEKKHEIKQFIARHCV